MEKSSCYLPFFNVLFIPSYPKRYLTNCINSDQVSQNITAEQGCLHSIIRTKGFAKIITNIIILHSDSNIKYEVQNAREKGPD